MTRNKLKFRKQQPKFSQLQTVIEYATRKASTFSWEYQKAMNGPLLSEKSRLWTWTIMSQKSIVHWQPGKFHFWHLPRSDPNLSSLLFTLSIERYISLSLLSSSYYAHLNDCLDNLFWLVWSSWSTQTVCEMQSKKSTNPIKQCAEHQHRRWGVTLPAI